ncbi:MAG: hypothetical protein AAF490_32795 [Chloroflexota bacterium]
MISRDDVDINAGKFGEVGKTAVSNQGHKQARKQPCYNAIR